MPEKKTKIFFSFHYSHDYQRICKVMESWLKFPDTDATSFIEDEVIEKMKIAGLPMIFKWIEDEVEAADLTVVLIGATVFGRYFIDYEINHAMKLKKPIFGIYIHQIENELGKIEQKGQNPLLPIYKTYDWVENKGETNIFEWVNKVL